MIADLPSASSHLADALAYAKAGFAVFPVWAARSDGSCSCGKPKCKSPGKHPVTPNGFKNASTDPNQIIRWWSAHPNANIGIATGCASRSWVLDLDLRKDGLANFERFRDGRELPRTSTQRTGGGGLQFFFAFDGEAAQIRSSADVIPGVDIRGAGGYVVVPPSNHKSGGTYAWLEGQSLFDLPLAAAPDWLVQFALKKAPTKSGSTFVDMTRGVEDAPDRQKVEAALAALDPNCDYDRWIQIGMAIHAAYPGNEGFALWDSWSSRATRQRGDGSGPVYTGPSGLSKHWDSFTQGAGITVATLFHLAGQGSGRGMQRTPSANGHRATDRPRPSRVLDDLDVENLGLSHLKFGRVLLDRHGEDLRHCDPWKHWLVWDGCRWKQDQESLAEQRATETQQWLKRLVGDAIEDVDQQIEAAQGQLNETDALGVESAEATTAEGNPQEDHHGQEGEEATDN